MLQIYRQFVHKFLVFGSIIDIKECSFFSTIPLGILISSDKYTLGDQLVIKIYR